MKIVLPAIVSFLLWPAAQEPKPTEPLAILEGHKEAILSIAFARDGKQVATGSADKFARVWNVADGEEIKAVTPAYAVTGIGFSKDGKSLATGSWGGQVWEIETGKRLVHLESHTGFVTCASYTPDGKLLATGGLDGTVKLFDIVTWAEVKSLPHGEQVNCMAFSTDGRFLLTAGDTLYHIWETASWKDLRSAKAPQIICAAFSPNGKHIATGHSDKTIRIWEVDTAKSNMVFPANSERVTGISFTPDGKELVSCGTAKLVKGWDTSNWKEIFSWKAHDAPVTCLAISPDGSLLATGSEDKTARIWKLPKTAARIQQDLLPHT